MQPRLRNTNMPLNKRLGIQDDPHKISIHSSQNFNRSESGSKRQNISRMLQNSRKKISMRKASELFSSGVRPRSTKIAKRNEIIQFDNIKWISIISAYDPGRLKNVSVSKQSCQKFLQKQGLNLKNDSRSLLYFNDLIKNFKSWLNKIQIQYYYIMEKFLNGRRSVNMTLTQLRPKLDEVIQQTAHMQQNLQDCLKTYQNHQFRQLLKRYCAYLQNSKQIEQIILVVNKSKHRIDDLFQRFEDDRQIQQRINKVRLEGIHQVRRIVCDHNQYALQNKIMERIQTAINQMAQKSGQAYRKIRGVKQLIQKFKNTEHQSDKMNKLDINTINLMSKVCKQICYEADTFQAFSQKFLLEGDIVNDDLKRVIKKYEEQVILERKKAIELQMKFLNIIFSETIKKLKENSKVSVVYENTQEHHNEYKKLLNMIQDISDCLLDQNKKVSLEKLIRQTRTIFDRLYDELKYLKKDKVFQQIDTQQGLISISAIFHLIKQYKQKIHLVRKKFEGSHRDLNLSPIKIQHITQDKQTQFINEIINLSKKINNSGLKQKIDQVQCFGPISHASLHRMSQQLNNQTILNQITSISNQFLGLQERNFLQKYFGALKLKNLIFKQSIIMLELRTIVKSTQQKNLIPQLEKITNKRCEWIQKHEKISSHMKRYFERILALTLVQGLKPGDIKQIDDVNCILFPEKQNQIEALKSKSKYRKVLFDLIQNSVLKNGKNITNQKSVIELQKSFDENIKKIKHVKKHNFYVSDILQNNIATISNFVNAFEKIQNIKRNTNGESYLEKQIFFEFCQKLFTEIFLKSKQDKSQKVISLFKQVSELSNNKVLLLSRKILQEENSHTYKKDKNQVSHRQSNIVPIHVQKIVEALQFYKSKAHDLLESCKKIIIQFKTPIQDVTNAQDQLRNYSKLTLYSKIVLSLIKYCKDTKQIIHAILDSQKNPIALINPKDNVLKQVFAGLKRGTQVPIKQVESINFKLAKIGIQLKKIIKQTPKVNEKNTKNIKKSKKSQDMSEQLDDMNQEYENQAMQDQIAEDNIQQIDNEDMPQDDIADDFEEEINQEPEEMMQQQYQEPQQQMEEYIQDEKVEEQNIEDILDQQQALTKSKAKNKSKHDINKSKNNIDEYQWQEEQEIDKKRNKKAQEQNKSKALKQQEEKLKEQQKNKEQQQKKHQQQQQKERQARIKKQHIVFSQTQIPKKIVQHSIYQVFSFITSLFQLKNLISYLFQFSQNYLKKQIDWQKIQQYFNQHSINKQNQLNNSMESIEKYIKSIDQQIQNKIKKDFQSSPKVFNQIKNLQAISSLKEKLLLIKNSNWEALQQLLIQSNLSFNVLKNPFKKANLYISIKNPKSQYNQNDSIHGYISKNFKHYKKQSFDLKSFTQKCFIRHVIQDKDQICKSISYSPKNQKVIQISSSQIQANFQKTKQIIHNFSKGAKDSLNKFQFCLQLYKKALKINEKVDVDLNWYSQQIKYLHKNGSDQNNFLFYFKEIKENMKNVIHKLKSLQSKLGNIAYKCTKQTIFQCFEQLCQLYGDQIQSKLTLSNENSKFAVLIFDKINYKQNLEKIKNIFANQAGDRQQQALKILLSIILGNQSNFVQIIKQNQLEQSKILENTKKINQKQAFLIVDVIQVLKISHSYILNEANNNVKFFIIRKAKQQCISGYLKKIVGSIQNKVQKAKVSHQQLQSIQLFLNASDFSAYNNLFIESQLQLLFKQQLKSSSKQFEQIKIIPNEEIFNIASDKEEQQNIKFFDSLLEILDENGNKAKQLYSSEISKLKPAKYIYEKYFLKQQPKSKCQWQKSSKSIQNQLSVTKKLSQRSNWLLSIKSIHSQIKKSIALMDQNINSIKSLLLPPKSISLDSLLLQIAYIFDWVIKNRQDSSKDNLFVVSLSNTKTILHFDFNVKEFNEEVFENNFLFINPQKNQLNTILFTILSSSMTKNDNNQSFRQFHNIKKQDISYEIDLSKIELSLTKSIQSVVSAQYQKNRQAAVRNFVRSFNRVYFSFNTFKKSNFQDQNSKQVKNVQKSQKQLIGSFKQLEKVYILKSFLQNYSSNIFKNVIFVESILQQIDLGLQSNFTSEDNQQVLAKLESIKINQILTERKIFNSFISWFNFTVKNKLKLQYYNVVTHSIKNQVGIPSNQLLSVILTEKPSNQQGGEELQSCLKQMFLIADHKSIYLKQNIYTVELTKIQVILEFEKTVKNVSTQSIIDYLNKNKQKMIDDRNKDLYLRVSQLLANQSGKKIKKHLKFIPITEFLKSSQQQTFIQLNSKSLYATIQLTFVYGPQSLSDDAKEEMISPLNDSLQKFEEIYLGKKVKLQKLSEYLHKLYKGDLQIEQNKEAQLQSFYKGFVQFFIGEIDQQNRSQIRKTIESIIKKVDFKNIFNTTVEEFSKQKLILQSSRNLIDLSSDQFEKYKKEQYQSNKKMEKYYGNDIDKMETNLNNQLVKQLIKVESKIRDSMGVLIKKSAQDEIQKIIKVRQQKYKSIQTAIRAAAQKISNPSQSQANPPADLTNYPAKQENSAIQSTNQANQVNDPNSNINKNQPSKQKLQIEIKKKVQDEIKKMQQDEIKKFPQIVKKQFQKYLTTNVGILILRDQFDQNKYSQISLEIQGQFKAKFTKQAKEVEYQQTIQKILQKIQIIYSSKQVSQINLLATKIMFLYLILRDNQFTYLKLFVSKLK